MPEGPSIIVLKEKVKPFIGCRTKLAHGNAKIDMKIFSNKTVKDFKSWGKHFLICFNDFTVRIHFLMFGSYAINERKNRKPRLSLSFRHGEINFYTCSVRIITEDINKVYDWSADVMNESWDPKKAFQKLKHSPEMLACDALLDQNIFSGVGNIIKNEVLFRKRIHPKSVVDKIPAAKLRQMIKDAVDYSFDFLKWKKNFELKKHWLAYNKKVCPRCNILLHKENLGKLKRRSFYCNNCQKLYS
jgi:endonuclease VIII